MTFKFGTDDEPEYYEFTNLKEFTEFYTGCVKHVSDTLAEGWKKKDCIDWEAYKETLDAEKNN